jgi:hypothetical protein
MLRNPSERTRQFLVLKQLNKALKKNILDRVRRDNMSECRGRKDHEGKTSRSVLYGLVFVHECALLVLFPYP